MTCGKLVSRFVTRLFFMRHRGVGVFCFWGCVGAGRRDESIATMGSRDVLAAEQASERRERVQPKKFRTSCG